MNLDLISNKVWNKVPVSQIADIILGGTPKTSIEDYWGGNIAWASAKDISNNNGRYIYETEKSITKKGLENSNARLLPKRTIVITARGTVGKLAILPQEMCFNQSCYGIIGKNEINQLFLYYALKESLNRIQSLTYGTIFDTITIKSFDELEIFLPDKINQEAISSVLNFIDSLIELNYNMNITLEKIAEAIFKSWFVDFEPFQDIEFIESEMGKTPKEWNIELLNNYAKIQNGKKVREKHDNKNNEYKIPIYSGATIIGYTNESKYNTPILITGRVGTLGLIHRVKDPCWASDNTIVIIPNHEIYYDLLYFYLKNAKLENYNRGAANPLIVQNDVKQIKILIPDEEILKRFSEITSPLFNKMKANKIESEFLINLRDLILPHLISGRSRFENPIKFLEEIEN